MSRIEKFNNVDEFEIAGFFKISNDQAIFGKLFHSIDGMFLELPISEDEVAEKIECLIGENKHEVISLFGLTRQAYYVKDIDMTKFRVNYMICDSKAHTDLEGRSFSKVHFSYKYLSSFISKQPDEAKSFYIGALNAELKEWISESSRSGQSSRDGFESSKQIKPNYSINYNIAKPLLDIKDDIIKFQKFLSILTGVYMPVSFFRFNSETKDLEGNMPFCGRFYFSQASGERKVPNFFSSYNYKALENHFAELLSEYFVQYESYEAILINLTTNLRYNNLVETQFFDAISCVEEIARLTMDNTRQLSEQVIKYREQVIYTIGENVSDKSEQDLIIRALQSMDEISLVSKIKRLCKDLPQELRGKVKLNNKKILINKDFIGMFSSKCVNTRNYHAHGSIDRSDKTFSPSEMFYVSKILNLITECHFMKKIGVEDNVIVDAILQKRNYYSVIEPYGYEPPMRKIKF
ncbi:HEPN domain-containing protein [Streptococcus pluranimalium]|uniref:Uncharacterized protein n=1 Tax=Streptococcus pluranimalium TaxID=82348 RepID=A0A2L0D4H5_9STRE|nr:HEPN domain-containing protein [Streptococcus pluranimalium]AUW96481.1 hypothetical protein C0J00_04860 [Streptococcus pluranimalium]